MKFILNESNTKFILTEASAKFILNEADSSQRNTVELITNINNNITSATNALQDALKVYSWISQANKSLADKYKQVKNTVKVNDRHSAMVQFINAMENSLNELNSNWKADYVDIFNKLEDFKNNDNTASDEVILNKIFTSIRDVVAQYSTFAEEDLKNSIIPGVSKLKENLDTIGKLDTKNTLASKSELWQKFSKVWTDSEKLKGDNYAKAIKKTVLAKSGTNAFNKFKQAVEDTNDLVSQMNSELEEIIKALNEEFKNDYEDTNKSNNWKVRFELALENKSNETVAEVWKAWFEEAFPDYSNKSLLIGMQNTIQKEIDAFGYEPKTNPMIVFLNKMLKNTAFESALKKDMYTYSAIHNAVADGTLDTADLEGKGELGNENIIFNDKLYSFPPNIIDRYLHIQNTAFNAFSKLNELSDTRFYDKYSKLGAKQFVLDTIYQPGELAGEQRGNFDGNIKPIDNIEQELRNVLGNETYSEVTRSNKNNQLIIVNKNNLNQVGADIANRIKQSGILSKDDIKLWIRKCCSYIKNNFRPSINGEDVRQYENAGVFINNTQSQEQQIKDVFLAGIDLDALKNNNIASADLIVTLITNYLTKNENQD